MIHKALYRTNLQVMEMNKKAKAFVSPLPRGLTMSADLLERS